VLQLYVYFSSGEMFMRPYKTRLSNKMLCELIFLLCLVTVALQLNCNDDQISIYMNSNSRPFFSERFHKIRYWYAF